MKKILIVEDHEMARRMLAIALQRTAHEVHEATNGTMALKIVKEHSPAVVLLDIVLADEMDGFDVCEQIKTNPASQSTFVILTSGMDDQASFDKAKRVGANAYLVKPFRLSRLIDIAIHHKQLVGSFILEPSLPGAAHSR
jgi:PleD family two-component response regulator